MNKKAYIAPSMEATNIETVEMMAASTPNIAIIREGNGGEEMLGNERRGIWGDLWD